MRIRIVQRPAGVIEGVSLGAFIPGVHYDVTPSLAHYLVSQHYAEELRDMTPVVILPMDTPPTLYSPFRGGVHVDQHDAGDSTLPIAPQKSE